MMQKIFTDSAVCKKEKDMLREQIKSLSTLIVESPCAPPANDPVDSPVENKQPKARKPTSPPLFVMAEKFVFADKDKNEDTKKATRKTVSSLKLLVTFR